MSSIDYERLSQLGVSSALQTSIKSASEFGTSYAKDPSIYKETYGFDWKPSINTDLFRSDEDVLPLSGDYGYSSTPQQLVYFDAPYAEKYGMSAETAYQEALANSAYQRKVVDLKKAGLNPVLGIQGSGAASFHGESASSGGSGSYNSGKSSKDSNFTSIPFIVGAAVSLFTGLKASPGAAISAGQLAQNVVSHILKNKD